VTGTALGTVTMAELVTSRAVVERTHRLIRTGDPQHYKFGLQVSGHCVIEQDGRRAALSPGDFAIYDASRPYRITFSDDVRMTVAMFPRALIQLPPAQLASITAVRLAGDQALAGLLTPLMRGLSSGLSPAGTAVAAYLGEAVVNLITAAFAQHLAQTLPEDTPAGHQVLAAQVYRFIDENLHQPDLSSRAIAAAHFVSIRHLQKVFEEEGESVTTVVRNRRIERCRRDLADPQLREAPIATIGARWGFPDAAHFSRLFRATYGYSPREYRMLHRVS
jgi:AraC-like DNA-binding protein